MRHRERSRSENHGDLARRVVSERRSPGAAPIVATTLYQSMLGPPIRKGGLVPRPALLARISAEAPRLAVIQAAAGFGKTSLLSQLHESLRGASPASAWLGLDASHNDYSRFLLHLIGTLESIGIPVHKTLKGAAERGDCPDPATARDLLNRAIAALDRRFIICVDDHHVLTDPRSQLLLSDLILAAHERLSWIITTRSTPNLPVNRLRLLNEIVELRTQDLRFTDSESREFFQRPFTPALDPELAALLNARVEGWVTGLQMASVSLKRAEDPALLIQRLSGTNRNIADFLQATVLERTDEPTLRFLLDTSILTRLSVELCNFVTARSDARARLDLLESRNAFIFPLDEERGWYRYHGLFAGLLERRLRDSDPDRLQVLHARASLWFEQNGCGVEAVEHALQGKDFFRAAHLLDKLALYEQGQLALQERLTARIPDSVLEQFPNLQLERIWGWEAEWAFSKSRTALNRLRRVVEDWRSGRFPVPGHVNFDYITAKLSHSEMMTSLVCDDMQHARRMCEDWLSARHCADTLMEVSAAGALLAARREHYDCAGIDVAVQVLHEVYRSARLSFAEIFQCSLSGVAYFMAGETNCAREMYERAFSSAIALHGPLAPLASMPALLLAEVHYEHGALDEARGLVADYLDVAHGFGFVDKVIAGYITKAKLEANDGRYELAQLTLDDAERCALANGFARLEAHVINERMRQLVLRGDQDGVMHLARRNNLLGSCIGLEPRNGVTTRHEALAVAFARAAGAQGNLDVAIRLIKNWCCFTASRQCHRSSIRLLVELAKLLYARGDVSAASHHLNEAIRLGAPRRFVRTFLDAGQAVRDLLPNAIVTEELTDDERSYGLMLLTAFPDCEERGAAHGLLAAPGKCRPELNRREIDILELAAGDVPNRQIAQRLMLSENTVKWYWREIFGKFGVRRRLQAVNAARAAGLI